MIKVVAALIEKENKILIAKRSTGDPNVLGKWEFPGGKVEPNEDEMHAIEREILEEFELEIKARKIKEKIAFGQSSGRSEQIMMKFNVVDHRKRTENLLQGDTVDEKIDFFMI